MAAQITEERAAKLITFANEHAVVVLVGELRAVLGY